MAFKILSAVEIELLTENQRTQYENELTIYNERVKFVEQLEKFENTVIEPYEPKLKYISAVNKAPEKTYSNPEYVVKTIEPIAKPELKVVTANFDEPITTNVPKYSKAKSVPVDHIKKVDPCRPTLPQISKAAAPVKPFTKAEQQVPALPQITKATAPVNSFTRTEQQAPVLPVSKKTVVPSKTFTKTEQANPKLPVATKRQIFMDVLFVSVALDNDAIRASTHTMDTPAIGVPAFVAPEKTQPLLPKTTVKCLEVNVFKKPEISAVDLPKAVTPQQVNVSFKKANKTKAKLPEVSNIASISVSFNKPEPSKAKLPITAKTNIPNSQFKKTGRTLSALPVIGTIRAGIQSYTAPENQKTVLPTFTRPVAAFNPDFKQLNDSTSKIEYPSISVAPIKPFKKVTGNASGIPSVNAVAVPDAYANESLKKLLPTNKRTKVRKEQLHEKQ